MRQVRAVLHAHSTWSYDGSWDLSAIARLFGRMGASVVMMSEHDTGFDPGRFGDYRAACAAASTQGCTLVPGIEYSSPDNDIHILTWGLDRFLAEHRPVAETLARVAEAGGVAIFAHPVRRDAWARFDPDWVPHLAGIELWNRKSDGIAPGARARALLAQTGLAATTGVDFHRAKQIYPLGNRIGIEDGAALEPGLVAGIRAGRITPTAFGRSLLDTHGGLKGDGLHGGAERLRKGLVRLVKGRR